MKIKFRSVKAFLIIFLVLVCLIDPASADAPYGQEIKKDQEIQKLQQDIASLEDVLKLLSDEKQRSASISQIESLLAAKRESLAQKTGAAPITRHGGPLNFIQLFQNVKKNLSHLDLLKRKVGHLSEDYGRIKEYLSNREVRLRLLDTGLKLVLFFVFGVILWLLSQKLTQKWKASCQRRDKASLSGKLRALSFHLFLKTYPLVILFLLAWGLLSLLFSETTVSAALTVLGAWFGCRFFKNLCRLVVSPQEEEDRLFHLEDSLTRYILDWCRRILFLSLWAFILVRVSALLGLEQMSAAFFKIYKAGMLIALTIILTRWRESIRRRFSFTVEEKDPAWKIKVKNAYNQALGKAYLVLIIYFSGILMLDLLGYEQAAQISLYATMKSILVIALAVLVRIFWGRLFQKISILGRQHAQRYPDLEKQINQYIVWISRLVRLSIIILTLLIIMTIWKLDIFGFLARHSAHLFRLVRIPSLVLTAIILIQIIAFVIQKAARRVAETRIQKGEGPPVEVEKQMKTIVGMLHKTAAVFIWSVTGTMILKELGFSIGPLLAGAGVAGLAVGFGAQNLVRDILSGLFIIVENQVRVGDVAILNGTGGLVEAVNLRTTVLRGLDGTVHIFPNGTITTVSNMTHGFAYYVFDIGISYKEDVDQVFAALREVGDQIAQEEPYRSMILEPLEILGLDRLDDSSMLVKARIKTLPIKQWDVGREMNRRIKKRFDQEGIEIPFPHRTIYFGEKSKPIDINIRNAEDIGVKGRGEKQGEQGGQGMQGGKLRELIRVIVREILAEEKGRK
ncbi:MAG: mechanosensitive ion channel domain-containing protein [bacterium]